MELPKWQRGAAKSLGHDGRDLEAQSVKDLSEQFTGDEVGFWEEFHLDCPWRIEHNHVDDVGEYYCMAIVWQSGQTRPCVVGQCAPYHFVKSLAKAASR